MEDTSRYSILPDGRVLDSAPMENGDNLLVFDNGKWLEFEGTLGEWRHSIALTDSEAAALTESGTPSE